MRIDFPFSSDVPALLQFRCSLLNAIDQLASKLGAITQFPGQGLSPDLAFLQFRNFKDAYDQTAHRDHPYRTPRCRTIAMDYLCCMMPGVEFDVVGEEQYRPVDPEQVLGCSWRDYSPPPDPHAIMSMLNNAPRGHTNRARYLQVLDLPMYISSEGQNRVELFRRYRQPINAEVRQLVPTLLPVVYRSVQGDQWVSTWKNDAGVTMAATIPYPAIALPIFAAIGASIHLSRLPVDSRTLSLSLQGSQQRLAGAVGMA